MCQILVSRRVQASHTHRLKLEMIPLPNLPHVRILVWPSLLPSVRIMRVAMHSNYGKDYAHAKAGAQDNEKDD
jgi:hypothetical protein